MINGVRTLPPQPSAAAEGSQTIALVSSCQLTLTSCLGSTSCDDPSRMSSTERHVPEAKLRKKKSAYGGQHGKKWPLGTSPGTTERPDSPTNGQRRDIPPSRALLQANKWKLRSWEAALWPSEAALGNGLLHICVHSKCRPGLWELTATPQAPFSSLEAFHCSPTRFASSTSSPNLPVFFF